MKSTQRFPCWKCCSIKGTSCLFLCSFDLFDHLGDPGIFYVIPGDLSKPNFSYISGREEQRARVRLFLFAPAFVFLSSLLIGYIPFFVTIHKFLTWESSTLSTLTKIEHLRCLALIIGTNLLLTRLRTQDNLIRHKIIGYFLSLAGNRTKKANYHV